MSFSVAFSRSRSEQMSAQTPQTKIKNSDSEIAQPIRIISHSRENPTPYSTIGHAWGAPSVAASRCTKSSGIAGVYSIANASQAEPANSHPGESAQQIG